MKTKISVDIHKSGQENDFILKAVANHNSGKAIFRYLDLIGYCSMQNAVYPSIREMETIKTEDKFPVIHVSEDKGKTFTLTLTWKEVYELETTTEMDLSTKLS